MNNGVPEVGIVVAELIAQLSVEPVIQEYYLGSTRGGLLNQHIAWMGVAMDITIAKDHLAVELSDLSTHIVGVDSLASKPVDIIDMTTRTILHHKHSICSEGPMYSRYFQPRAVFEDSSNFFSISCLLEKLE